MVYTTIGVKGSCAGALNGGGYQRPLARCGPNTSSATGAASAAAAACYKIGWQVVLQRLLLAQA
jgi:hypothetical protein